MAWFVDDADVTPIVTVCRSRALGAGVDPFQYDGITAKLHTLRDWLPSFHSAAEEHVHTAEAAQRVGHSFTARQSWKAAAACAHIANTLPHPDIETATAADRLAAHALKQYATAAGHVYDLASPAASAPDKRFIGELRIPDPAPDSPPPVVIIVAGLDSGRAEFIDLADALLARGIAVAAIDGPGQGELADLPPQPAFQHVTTFLIDTLIALDVIDAHRIGLIGLSLGGLYAMRAATDPRIRALATVSGAHPWPTWTSMPAFAVDTLTIRCGGIALAHQFTDALAQADLPHTVAQPMLVVAGGQDQLPTPEQAQQNAAVAPMATCTTCQTETISWETPDGNGSTSPQTGSSTISRRPDSRTLTGTLGLLPIR